MDVTQTHSWGTQPEMFGPRHEHRLRMILRETAGQPEGTRTLDAAIGLGQLASRLQRQGLKVFGIDSSIEAARFVRTERGIPVVIGDLSAMPFRASSFGVITSGETLEHLDDDEGAVIELERVLTGSGRCVVTVPAMQMLWTSSDDYYEHRRRYSRSGLRGMFERARFAVRKARFWGFPVVLIYDTLFLLPMNKRRSRVEPSGDPALRSIAAAGRNRFLVSAMRGLFAIDGLFSRIPFGPGLLLVATKRTPSDPA